MLWVQVCSYVPNTEALHHLEKPQTVAPPPEEHEEDEEMEEAKAEPPKLWLSFNTEMLKVSKLVFFFWGGGEIFVYKFLVMFAYFFEKYMYTMYGRFLNHWKIFGNTFPHFSGWWFQTFAIFIPKLVKDQPILTSIFFKWVGSTTNQFYVSPRSLKKWFNKFDRHVRHSAPEIPQCQLQYHWGRKKHPGRLTAGT